MINNKTPFICKLTAISLYKVPIMVIVGMLYLLISMIQNAPKGDDSLGWGLMIYGMFAVLLIVPIIVELTTSIIYTVFLSKKKYESALFPLGIYIGVSFVVYMLAYYLCVLTDIETFKEVLKTFTPFSFTLFNILFFGLISVFGVVHISSFVALTNRIKLKYDSNV